MPDVLDQAQMVKLLVDAINQAMEDGLHVHSVEVQWSYNGLTTVKGRSLDIKAYFV